MASATKLRFVIIPKNWTFYEPEIDASYRELWSISESVRKRLKIDRYYSDIAADMSRRMWFREIPLEALNFVTEGDFEKIQAVKGEVPVLMKVEISRVFLTQIFPYWEVLRRHHYSFTGWSGNITMATERWNGDAGQSEKVPEKFSRSLSNRIMEEGDRLSSLRFDAKSAKRIAEQITILGDYREEFQAAALESS